MAGPDARPPRPAAARRAPPGPRRDGRLPLPRAPPRVPPDPSRREPPAGRRGAPPVHRRDDRHAQGRHAHPPQPRRERGAGPVLVPAAARRARGDPGCRAPLPRLRPPECPPPRRLGGGGDDPRAAPAAARHRARGAPPVPPHALPGSAHPLLRPRGPPAGEPVRPAHRHPVPLRGGLAAREPRGALRGAHRGAPRRGLRPHRDLAAHPRQPHPRRAARGEHRPAGAGHRRADRGPRDRRRASRPGRRASSRCAGPR